MNTVYEWTSGKLPTNNAVERLINELYHSYKIRVGKRNRIIDHFESKRLEYSVLYKYFNGYFSIFFFLKRISMES